ncbi:DUF2306 domain-containing protein [Portibacter lacus]|uniref:Membrane protein n=1 Tax=Portibacter lacus TaxID=1099794 RepID=A0AA37SU13_9BACT|nr:DUF2306 domain-containing protein [Portibacter lacus]GLR18020.1 membrane protein [Portibacter lacus]
MKTANLRLEQSIRTLFYIGLMGQLFFAIYIFLFYGGSAIKGDWNTWTEAMIHGIIEGDPIGNIVLVVHILLAFIITVCGPIQFFKWIRINRPTLHKWNGRIYIMTALVISTFAIYMIMARDAKIGGELGRIATTTNGLLIIVFAILTWRTGVKKQFAQHRKWAIRTFIVVSGVWFFRIGFGVWILITGFTAPGTSADLSGPFDRLLYFGSYLVPLAIAEFYLYVKDSKHSKLKFIGAGFFFMLCVILLGGTAITAKFFWLDSL